MNASEVASQVAGFDPVPAISVVVPTFNRRDRLERVLEGLARQDFDRPFEVIVVSDGSTDGTNAYLSAGATPLPVHALLGDNAGPAGARNRGIAHAQGDLVVFIDDDVVAAPGLLAAHWAAHRDDDRLVVIGPMCSPVDHAWEPWVAWEQTMLERQYDAMRRGKFEATARQFYTGNASMRRSHLVASGGFDETFRRAEDVELAYRLSDSGLRFHFAPEAVSYHYANRSYEAWLGVAHAYGRNDVIFARDRGQHWIPREIKDKYSAYPTPVRYLLRATSSGRRRTTAVTTASRWLALGLFRLRARRAALTVLSGAYATEYFRGVADEVGGRHELRTLLRTGSLPPEQALGGESERAP